MDVGSIIGGIAGAVLRGGRSEQAAAPTAGVGADGGNIPGARDLASHVDLAGLGRLLNPNLPADQARGLDIASGVVRTFLGGGARAPITGGDADPTKAGTMPGTPDEALARTNAKRTIEAIDWSKPNVAIWVPGTHSRGVPADFAASLGADTSAVALEYPATTDFTNSVSTGMLTTRLVLEEAARRGKGVVLGGHSQGAWVAGEVMADPATAPLVRRAVLYGHPSVANAQFDSGRDPKVREVNNADDPYSQPIGGGVAMVQGISNLTSGRIDAQSLAAVITGAATNPAVTGYLLGQRRPDGTDQHGYRFDSEAAFLSGR